ncbi:MAG: CehA/McbA family metallohydrolase [Anaerolineales bacterium]|nr:CehA/McbA family metallohydrolase [Anaerolineales bacterium]
MIEIVLEGRFEAADQARNPFPLLPFDVPPGIIQLDVHYETDHPLRADQVGWQEGNIVDIGLFDPRGAEFGRGAGFRGWSGSSRASFSITPAEASPGYLSGPIYPGTWHVLLGLYQLAPQGCTFRVTVSLTPGDASGCTVPVDTPSIAPSVPAGGARWYRGDLHAHTWHSDGSAPLADLIAAARTQKLDFIAVTEHNTISHLPLLPAHHTPDLLLIPGVEISTYHGHANVWPAEGFVEFRCKTTAKMVGVREAVRANSALFSVNHPKDGGPAWEFDDLLDPDCVEVWGGPWIISNYQSLAAWDELLCEGRRVTAVGGSDKHQGPFTGELGWYEIGTPCTWVYAETLSVEAILAAIRAGRVFISEGPEGPRLEMTARTERAQAGMGDVLRVAPGERFRITCHVGGATGQLLRLVSRDETLEFEVDQESFTLELPLSTERDTYWRAEVIEPPEAPLDEEPSALIAKALGNPIHVRL